MTTRRRRVASETLVIPSEQSRPHGNHSHLDNHRHHHYHYHHHIHNFPRQQFSEDDQDQPMVSSGSAPSMDTQRNSFNRLAFASGSSSQREIALAATDRLNERVRTAALLRDRHNNSGGSGSFLEEFGNLFDDDVWSHDLWEVMGIEELLSDTGLDGRSHNDGFLSLDQGSTSLGLSKAAIKRLPRELFLPNGSGSSRQDECSVCLEHFQLGQQLICLPCKHKFHSQCLTPWLESHVQCPYCRSKINAQGKADTSSGQHNVSIDDLLALMETVDSGTSRPNMV